MWCVGEVVLFHAGSAGVSFLVSVPLTNDQQQHQQQLLHAARTVLVATKGRRGAARDSFRTKGATAAAVMGHGIRAVFTTGATHLAETHLATTCFCPQLLCCCCFPFP